MLFYNIVVVNFLGCLPEILFFETIFCFLDAEGVIFIF